MASDPQREGGPRLPEDEILRQLVEEYGIAEAAIVEEIRRVLQQGVTPRRRAESLRTVGEILDRLAGRADPLARRAVRTAYEDSEAATGRLMQAIVATPDPGPEFSRVNERAIRELQQSVVDRLSGARRTLGRAAADVYAREGRRAVALGLLGDRGSRRAVSRELVDRLTREGVTSFVDRAGRRWQLGRYAAMVARTVTREAVTAAAVARMMEGGVNVARVSTHGTACRICAPLEGRLVLLGGEVPEGVDGRVWQPSELPGLTGMPPFHPNCRHTIVPEAVRFEQFRREFQAAKAA